MFNISGYSSLFQLDKDVQFLGVPWVSQTPDHAVVNNIEALHKLSCQLDLRQDFTVNVLIVEATETLSESSELYNLLTADSLQLPKRFVHLPTMTRFESPLANSLWFQIKYTAIYVRGNLY